MTTQIARSRESGNPLQPPHGIYDVLKIVVEIFSELLLFIFSLFVCVFVVVVVLLFFLVSYLDLIYITICGF